MKVATEPTTLIQAAEDLLACRQPKPGPYWPSKRPGEPEEAFRPIRWDSFEYHLISHEGGEYNVFSDEEILKINPDFRQTALLEAIEEVITFARLFLTDEAKPGSQFSFVNVYLSDDMKALCRRHLTQLLGRWYELESQGGAE